MEFIEAFSIYAIILLILALIAIYVLPVIAAILIASAIIGKIIQLILKKREQARKEAAVRAHEERVRAKEEQKARIEAYNQSALEQMAMMRSPLIERKAKNTVFLYGFPDMPAGADECRADEYRQVFNAITDGGYQIGEEKVIGYHTEGTTVVATILWRTGIEINISLKNYDEIDGYDPIQYFRDCIHSLEEKLYTNKQ